MKTTDRKPPLARSPMQIRSRRALKPSNIATPLRTPIATMRKPQMKGSEIKQEYQSISRELNALSKLLKDEIAAVNAKNHSNDSTNLLEGSTFEKGCFYDEYIAKRNARLRMKKKLGNEVIDNSLRVKVDASSKKKDFRKKVGNEVDRSQHPRYSLRSGVKKPLMPVAVNVERETPARRSVCALRPRRK